MIFRKLSRTGTRFTFLLLFFQASLVSAATVPDLWYEFAQVFHEARRLVDMGTKAPPGRVKTVKLAIQDLLVPELDEHLPPLEKTERLIKHEQDLDAVARYFIEQGPVEPHDRTDFIANDIIKLDKDLLGENPDPDKLKLAKELGVPELASRMTGNARWTPAFSGKLKIKPLDPKIAISALERSDKLQSLQLKRVRLKNLLNRSEKWSNGGLLGLQSTAGVAVLGLVGSLLGALHVDFGHISVPQIIYGMGGLWLADRLIYKHVWDWFPTLKNWRDSNSEYMKELLKANWTKQIPVAPELVMDNLQAAAKVKPIISETQVGTDADAALEVVMRDGSDKGQATLMESAHEALESGKTDRAQEIFSEIIKHSEVQEARVAAENAMRILSLPVPEKSNEPLPLRPSEKAQMRMRARWSFLPPGFEWMSVPILRGIQIAKRVTKKIKSDWVWGVRFRSPEGIVPVVDKVPNPYEWKNLRPLFASNSPESTQRLMKLALDGMDTPSTREASKNIFQEIHRRGTQHEVINKTSVANPHPIQAAKAVLAEKGPQLLRRFFPTFSRFLAPEPEFESVRVAKSVEPAPEPELEPEKSVEPPIAVKAQAANNLIESKKALEEKVYARQKRNAFVRTGMLGAGLLGSEIVMRTLFPHLGGEWRTVGYALAVTLFGLPRIRDWVWRPPTTAETEELAAKELHLVRVDLESLMDVDPNGRILTTMLQNNNKGTSQKFLAREGLSVLKRRGGRGVVRNVTRMVRDRHESTSGYDAEERDLIQAGHHIFQNCVKSLTGLTSEVKTAN